MQLLVPSTAPKATSRPIPKRVVRRWYARSLPSPTTHPAPIAGFASDYALEEEEGFEPPALSRYGFQVKRGEVNRTERRGILVWERGNERHGGCRTEPR